jgi:hypothetical protein
MRIAIRRMRRAALALFRRVGDAFAGRSAEHDTPHTDFVRTPLERYLLAE